MPSSSSVLLQGPYAALSWAGLYFLFRGRPRDEWLAVGLFALSSTCRSNAILNSWFIGYAGLQQVRGPSGQLVRHSLTCPRLTRPCSLRLTCAASRSPLFPAADVRCVTPAAAMPDDGVQDRPVLYRRRVPSDHAGPVARQQRRTRARLHAMQAAVAPAGGGEDHRDERAIDSAIPGLPGVRTCISPERSGASFCRRSRFRW